MSAVGGQGKLVNQTFTIFGLEKLYQSLLAISSLFSQRTGKFLLFWGPK